ncbi:MAG: 4Fe-4S binding protein, partial [Deltaproteobacteria bacterium]|nr:4Fe-4S binding protein [Deltaproteobacteria bacterium]
GFDFISGERDGIRVSDRGFIDHDPETLEIRNSKGVFIAGDAAHGTKLMIDAIASGKKAARGIHNFLTGKSMDADSLEIHIPIGNYQREKSYENIARAQLPAEDAGERVKGISKQVELLLSDGDARLEGSRCLDCGVNTIFHGENCILCGGCADVCPEVCLKLLPFSEVDGGEEMMKLTGGDPVGEFSAIIKDETRCIRCGLCAERCPNGAITMERFYFKTNLVIKGI